MRPEDFDTVQQGEFLFLAGVADLDTKHHIPEGEYHASRLSFDLVQGDRVAKVYTYGTQADYLSAHLVSGSRVVAMGRFKGELREGTPVFVAARSLGVTLPFTAHVA